MTPDLIRSVAKDSLGLATEVLTALKTGQYEKLVSLNVEDLFPVKWEVEISSVIAGVKSSEPVAQPIATNAKVPAALSPKAKHTTSKPQAYPAAGLLAIVENGLEQKVGAYAALKAVGHIRPANEFMRDGLTDSRGTPGDVRPLSNPISG